MDHIIEQLMSPDTNAINEATRDLNKYFKNPEAFEALYNVMTSHQTAAVRQYAAVILRMILEKQRNNQQVPSESLTYIKNNMLNGIFVEKENNVRAAMTQCFGCVLRHEEAHKNFDAWVDGVVQFIAALCTSNDAQTVEIASFVLSKLADETPECFVERFSVIAEFISGAFTTAAMPAIVAYNILATMSSLVPVIYNSELALKTFEQSLPHLLGLLKKYADESATEHFTMGLELLQSIAEYAPTLLNLQMREITEFVCFVGSTVAYDAEVRIKALTFVPFLITERKNLLVKLQLIEPMLEVLFEIMATEPESDNADEFFVESDGVSILAAANVAIDTLAVNLPAERFIPPLLALLEPALQQPGNDLRRRAAYIALATISEGCRDAICQNYLEAMLGILKNGLSDTSSIVRSAALYAIGQFSEQLQPEIADYADAVLPQLLQYMQEVLQAHQLGQQLEVKLVERLFYALEAFCENMDKRLAPYIESIMTAVLTALDNVFPQRIQILVLELTESAGKAYDDSLLQWSHPLVERLLPMLWLDSLKHDPYDGVRSQALSTLAQIARNIGQAFRPYVGETLHLCLQKLEAGFVESLFNLIGALATIVGEELVSVLPTFLTHIENVLNEGMDTRKTHIDKLICEAMISDEESDVASQALMAADPQLNIKQQAIYTIKELAENCPHAMLNYNHQLLTSIYKHLQIECTDLQRSCIDASKTLVIKWCEQVNASTNNNDINAKHATQLLLKKLIELVNDSMDKDVVNESLNAIGELVDSLGAASLPTQHSRLEIVQCIRNGLTCQYECQENSDTVKSLIENAADLLVPLGRAISIEEYVVHFHALEPLVLQHLQTATANDAQTTRAFLFGVLAECYASLGAHIVPYYQKHFNLLLSAARERNAKIRQTAIFGLGELMRAAGETSYDSFAVVLSTLSDLLANERKRYVIDNILGTLARLILTNVALVPLEQVLPVMLQNLPIEKDLNECDVVIECFRMLYERMPDSITSHIAALITTEASGQQLCEDKLVEAVICLIGKV